MKEKETHTNDKSVKEQDAQTAPAEETNTEKTNTEEQKSEETKSEAAEEKAGEAEASPNFEPTPEDRIAELEKKVADTEKLRLMALAEMDNQRKRFAREMENLRQNVTQDTLFPFLQVFDHFTMAVSASSATGTLDSLLKGMEMIQKEFDRAFSDLGIEKIDAVGKTFDPHLHEAVSQEASDTVPQGTVIRQWSMGYKTGTRLLKPAMVVVSSGPAAQETEPGAEEAKK